MTNKDYMNSILQEVCVVLWVNALSGCCLFNSGGCLCFLLAGGAHRQLHRAERAGAALPLSGWSGASRSSACVEGHPRRGSGQRHPPLDPGASRPQRPVFRVGPHSRSLPHAGLPRPGHGERVLGEPGGSGGGRSASGQQSGLRPPCCGCRQSGAEGPAGVLQLPHGAAAAAESEPSGARLRVAPWQRHVPHDASAGLQTPSSDRRARGRHLRGGTGLLRVPGSAALLKLASVRSTAVTCRRGR